ncbi:hypothetical protein [Streptomyces sp. NPDC049881]|uniref:hypothetical protein n=1 Tax=unclassified Streptomyces TaxID=2593676 RepID=UPI003441C3F0
MNAPGTIGRPAPHGPRRELQMTLVTTEPGTAPRAARPRTEDKLNRTSKLQLIQEAMARSHMSERIREAESQRTAHQLTVARRLERRSARLLRKAERASHRARRALARTVMH